MASPLLTELEPVPDAPADAVEPPPVRRWYFEHHAIMLAISVVVLALAATMSVRGEGTQVSLPMMSVPLPELCHMRRFTGLDCPGCGLTRCFISLAHGDLMAAARYNLGGVLLFGLLIAQLPYRSVQLWRVSHGLPALRVRRLSTALAVILMSTLILQWMWKIVWMSTGGA
jgi:hypothetical protein